MVNALIFPVTDVDTLKRYFYFLHPDFSYGVSTGLQSSHWGTIIPSKKNRDPAQSYP
jgi:hypothetical protein